MISVRKVDVAEQLGELLARVAAGDSVEILDGSTAIARIVPAPGPVDDETAQDQMFGDLLRQVRAMMPKDLTLEEMLRYRDEDRR